jgi:hypothetical protein
MLDLGFVTLLALWSAGVGLWLLKWFGPWPEEPADSVALAVPLGLGVLGLAALGLGEAGALNTGRLGMVFGLGTLVGLPALRRFVRETRQRPPGERARPEGIDRAIRVLLGVCLAGTLLTAMAPVTDGDALCYHLQVPKWFLVRGEVGYDPDLHETVYPLLTEMLYAVALAFRGPVACRLVQWLLGLVFAANVTALARPSLGHRAWWAGTVAVLVPAVSNGMSAPLNDVALAAFGTAALVGWSRFRDRPSLRDAALTGILTGLAMGVKYPALVLAGLIGLTTAPGFRSRRPAHLVAFVLAAWAIGGVWYARAFVHTGNPVHPFFRQTFAGAGLDEVLGPEKRPMDVGPWNLLTALGPMTLEPDRFDSFSHQFGPVFLLFLPALLWERPPRRVLALAAMGYAFLALCLTQRQSMRFVLIATGPMSVAVAWLASRWWERRSWPGRALVGALMLALTFESAVAAARARHGLAVVLGVESQDSYLSRREPTYRVGRWVDQHLPPSARLVGQDHRGYYIPRDYTMELAHRRRTGLGRNGESPADVVARLRGAGFTHLMLCPPVPETVVEFDPTLGRLLTPWLDGRVPVYREDLSDADGVVRRYAIYSLADDRLAAQESEPPR